MKIFDFFLNCDSIYYAAEYFSGSRPREKIFEFDHVFGDKETQEKVFATCVKQQIDAVMNGYNATVFAYGATGNASAVSQLSRTEGILCSLFTPS